MVILGYNDVYSFIRSGLNRINLVSIMFGVILGYNDAYSFIRLFNSDKVSSMFSLWAINNVYSFIRVGLTRVRDF